MATSLYEGLVLEAEPHSKKKKKEKTIIDLE